MIDGPIKALQIIHGTGVAGPGRILFGLAKSFDRGEFLFDALCPPEGPLAEDMKKLGVKIIPFEPKRRWDPAYMLKILITLKREGYHVFNCHSGMLNAFSRIIGRLIGVPVIIFTEHQVAGEHIWIDTKARLFGHNLLHWLSNMMVDRVIAVSNITRDSFIKRQGIRPEKVVAIYNGVDTEALISMKADTAGLKKAWGIPQDVPVVGLVARLNKEKGHDTFIMAAKEILKERPETRFLIVGDGEDRDEIERLIRDTGLPEKFIMTGFQENVFEFIDMMDIVVQPSLARTEAFGLSLVEAMARKKAVIASNIRCFSEIITDGEDGLLFPLEDSRALAKKLVALINDGPLRERLGAVAQDMVIKKFNIKIMTERVQELYKEALSSKGFYLKSDYLPKMDADFTEYMKRGMVLSTEQLEACHASMKRYMDFIRDRRLNEEEVREYLEREDNFIIDTFLQFLDKMEIYLDRMPASNNELFRKAIRAKAVTAKDYDERIRMQTLQFQIDNYYKPGDRALKARIDTVLSFLRPGPGEKILDVGCGVGTFAYHCARAGARGTGVDYSEESIRVAKRLAGDFGVSANTEFICCDAAGRLPYDDASFDKIVAADFMEHIDDAEKREAIREMSRVLKPGGIMVIFMPNGIREKVGSAKNALWQLFGPRGRPETRLHYGLTDRFRFEKMLKVAGLAFDRKFFDVTRPYLARIPVFNEILSLEILWVVRK